MDYSKIFEKLRRVQTRCQGVMKRVFICVDVKNYRNIEEGLRGEKEKSSGTKKHFQIISGGKGAG